MSKSKHIFEEPFIGTNTYPNGITVVYTATGDSSVIFKIENPVIQYSGDSTSYYEAHDTYAQIIKSLGEGYFFQKTDVITRAKWHAPKRIVDNSTDYLEKKFFQEYDGRVFKNVTSYLTITKKGPKGRMTVYDAKAEQAFLLNVQKVFDLLEMNKINVSFLDKKKIQDVFQRYLAMDFSEGAYSLDNLYATESEILLGDKSLFNIQLLDIDDLEIPNSVTPHAFKPEIGSKFPVDNFNWLFDIDAETLIYSQIIQLSNQQKVRAELEAKKKRHKSMPDPENVLSVEDIDQVLIEVADSNELLIDACNYLTILTEKGKKERVFNSIKNYLFAMGITPSKKTRNQYELWRSAIPGNATELSDYNFFRTSRPAGLCFLFNERLAVSEESDYLLWFMDRQGVPVAIDTSELPIANKRIVNRNKFILGPSGTGKSFFTNRYVKQCCTLGADVVLVDNGDSYEGLCNYFNGIYFTYTESNPITMNPFIISPEENTEEHRDFIKTLISVIWKTAEGNVSTVEDSLLTQIITEYYDAFFLQSEESKRIPELSFNSFYEFSLKRIPEIVQTEKITFSLSDFAFILKKFYRTGQYPTVLNATMEKSLFTERFIVFEIDNIKNNKTLFPITTLIIMQVFLQKMKMRKNRKKILVIEEAWKAIASPIMADYILYLYKTIRKYDGEAIVVTQEVSDILDNPIIKKSIINNSDTIILLDQAKLRSRYEEISDVLSLDIIEQRKIFTIHKLDNKENRGTFNEVYIKRGEKGEIYGVEVPLHEYFTYTTNKKEKEALHIFLNEYKDYGKALDALVDTLLQHQETVKFQRLIPYINNMFTIGATENELYEYYRQTLDFKSAIDSFLKDFLISGKTIKEFCNQKLSQLISA